MAGPGFEYGKDGPRVIVVGVDLSRTGLRAAAFAAGLARRGGARLVAVHVEGHSAMVPPIAAAAAQQAHSDITSELRRLFDAYDAEQEPQAGATFLVRQGDPAGELMRVAEEYAADAVVVGASEAPGHRVMGSAAVRLVRAGRWPVTVVP